MLNVNYQVRINNFQDSTKEYIDEKLSKLNKLIKDYQALTVKIDQQSNIKNSITIYKIEINLVMPNVFIKVAAKGENINQIIDSLMEPLTKKIKRYNSQKERWSAHKEWKQEQILEQELLASANKLKQSQAEQEYIPDIKRKYYENDRPMHPSEAIERMELLGHDSFLFKNIENMKYGMIYRRSDGGYGLIQPQS
jgi:putative sigma-54 modulation protein